MKKAIYIFLIFTFLGGCATMKQGWRDFTAYYNTFYNAKQYYDSGLQANKRQVADINPLLPIRVHPSPTSAGLDDFEAAIERGSSILRNHEQSRYVLPSIALIGKSYFYRSEYFAALEKFRELNTLAEGNLQGEGVLWMSRTYLEMANYNEGVRFLEIEADIDENWDQNLLAEIYTVQAQLYVKTGDYEQAAYYLQLGTPGLENREMRARALFLAGQVFELLGSDAQALYAYSRVTEIRTSYDLEFNAKKKEADVARRIESFDRAEDLYRRMARDDKFYDYRNELRYEIARTKQLRGETEEAISDYNQVLRDRLQQPSGVTRAKTYFGLGEIYRDQLNDFTMAAAYFDSAANQRIEASLLPQNFNARELADSFGQYATIRAEINHRDSLLAIAALSPEELDELVEELQRIEMERLELERSEMQDERDRLLVAEEPDTIIDATESTEHGFLNIRSQTMLMDASLQFQAIWGDRPLADNWRRRADVRGSRFDQLVLAGDGEEIVLEEEMTEAGALPVIDLGDVPFSDEERAAMEDEILEWEYRLANVFFLSLNMPDSAEVYYRRVADRSPQENLVTMSLYTLAEIELLRENSGAARALFDELYEFSPGSLYAERLADRVGADFTRSEVDELSRIEYQYHSLIPSNGDTLAAARAEKLIELAENGSSDSQRALLLFEAAKEYIQAAHHQSETRQMVQEWFRQQEEAERQRNRFESMRDSARVMLQDTTLSETEQNRWSRIADSTLTVPDLSDIFPFEGAYWDSTRSLLTQIETYYASSEIMPRVQILRQTLQKPDSPDEADTPPEGPVSDDAIREELMDDSRLQTCRDLGIGIDYEGGMDAFMQEVSFPAWTQDLSMRGEVAYIFSIEPDGEISAYEQTGSMDRSGIPQAIEAAIDHILRFQETGQESPVRCRLSFPIDF